MQAKIFRPVAAFFFLVKVPFFVVVVFLMQKDLWPYRLAHAIPLVTLILYIYIWVCGLQIHRQTNKQTNKKTDRQTNYSHFII